MTLTRREFLFATGFGLACAALASCSQRNTELNVEDIEHDLKQYYSRCLSELGNEANIKLLGGVIDLSNLKENLELPIELVKQENPIGPVADALKRWTPRLLPILSLDKIVVGSSKQKEKHPYLFQYQIRNPFLLIVKQQKT